MAVFIIQETDPFTVVAEREAARGVQFAAQMSVRRPTRGLEVSEDVYSYLKVVDGDGRAIPLLSSGAQFTDETGRGRQTAYSNYLLQRIQIQRAELRQFVRTFGSTYLFFFGENPIIATIEGALIHSEDFRWDEEWWVNYEETLRGSKLAERGARVYLAYEGVLLEGYILETSSAREAMAPHLTPLALQMVVTAIKFLRPVGRTDYPIRSFVVDLTAPGAYTTLIGRQLSDRKRFTYTMTTAASALMAANRLALAAQLGSGLISDIVRGEAPINLEFGSFTAMFRTLLGIPGHAAGLFNITPARVMGSPVAGALTSVAQAFLSQESDPKRVTRVWNLPMRSKIWDNVDEYVVRPGTEQGVPSKTARDRVRLWHEFVDPGEDAVLAGDAERLATDVAADAPITSDTVQALEASHSIRTGGGTQVLPSDAVPRRSGIGPHLW